MRLARMTLSIVVSATLSAAAIAGQDPAALDRAWAFSAPLKPAQEPSWTSPLAPRAFDEAPQKDKAVDVVFATPTRYGVGSRLAAWAALAALAANGKYPGHTSDPTGDIGKGPMPPVEKVPALFDGGR